MSNLLKMLGVLLFGAAVSVGATTTTPKKHSTGTVHSTTKTVHSTSTTVHSRTKAGLSTTKTAHSTTKAVLIGGSTWPLKLTSTTAPRTDTTIPADATISMASPIGV